MDDHSLQQATSTCWLPDDYLTHHLNPPWNAGWNAGIVVQHLWRKSDLCSQLCIMLLFLSRTTCFCLYISTISAFAQLPIATDVYNPEEMKTRNYYFPSDSVFFSFSCEIPGCVLKTARKDQPLKGPTWLNLHYVIAHTSNIYWPSTKIRNEWAQNTRLLSYGKGNQM